MRFSRVMGIGLMCFALWIPGAVWAQTPDDAIVPPPEPSGKDTADGTAPGGEAPGKDGPGPMLGHPPGPGPVVVKQDPPPHLKTFGASIAWRPGFDADGPTGGAVFSLYYCPNYHVTLELSGFNIVSMTGEAHKPGDRLGGGAGAGVHFFPLRYNPEGYSYYLKANAIYEQIEYVLDRSIQGQDKANYFGLEAGAGVMFTLGSTLSIGLEASFLGTFTGDELEYAWPEASLGPFDRAALVLKLYFMARWNLVHWVQGPDGKFRDANEGSE